MIAFDNIVHDVIDNVLDEVVVDEVIAVLVDSYVVVNDKETISSLCLVLVAKRNETQ